MYGIEEYRESVLDEIWFQGGDPDTIDYDRIDNLYDYELDEYEAATCLPRKQRDGYKYGL